jgi:hypothetical protein
VDHTSNPASIGSERHIPTGCDAVIPCSRDRTGIRGLQILYRPLQELSESGVSVGSFLDCQLHSLQGPRILRSSPGFLLQLVEHRIIPQRPRNDVMEPVQPRIKHRVNLGVRASGDLPGLAHQVPHRGCGPQF